MSVCRKCNAPLHDFLDTRIINPSTTKAYFLCDFCTAEEEASGFIERCAHCGVLMDYNRVLWNAIPNLQSLNLYFDECPYCHHDIDAGKSKDAVLEKLYDTLEDVTLDEAPDGRLLLNTSWTQFPAGTDIKDVWKYFDEVHSKGVGWLTNRNNYRRLPQNEH